MVVNLDQQYKCYNCKKNVGKMGNPCGLTVCSYEPIYEYDKKKYEEIDKTIKCFGWICPKCGRVFSPDITECSCSSPNTIL